MRKTNVNIIICFILYSPILFSQNMLFEHLSVNDGLPGNNVSSIVQDTMGYIWIGSTHGLAKFDGFDVVTYNANYSDTNSLITSDVNQLFYDREKRLWIASPMGLVRYDPEYDNFKRYISIRKDTNSLGDENIVCIEQDDNGRFWLGTREDGVFVYDAKKKYYIDHYDESNQEKYVDNYVTDIKNDKNGDIWIASRGGIFVYKKNHNRVSLLSDIIKSKEKIFNTHIKSIFIDNEENIWMCTRKNGIIKYNMLKGRYIHYSSQKSGKLKIITDNSKAVFKDSKERIWMGTIQGLNIIDQNSGNINYYQKNPRNSLSLSDNSINIFYEDRDNNIWIGTFSGGINIYMQSSSNVHYIDNNFHSGIKDFFFQTIMAEDSLIWMGTKYGGLVCYNIHSQKFKHIAIKGEGVSVNHVFSLFRDSKNNFWIGTYNGLYLYEKSFIKQIKWNSYSITTDNNIHIYQITEDKNGRIWLATHAYGLLYIDRNMKVKAQSYASSNYLISRIRLITSIHVENDSIFWLGTPRGVILYNPFTDKLIKFYQHVDDQPSISNNNVKAIIEDKYNTIWVGTDFGLNRIFKDTQRIDNLSQKDGLPDNFIQSIVNDKNGKIWVSTLTGIVNIIPYKDDILLNEVNIKKKEKSKQYIQSSAYLDKKGFLYFGSNNGLVYFHPDSIRNEFDTLNTLITSLWVNNKRIIPGKETAILPLDIKYANNIQLNHTHKVFTIGFSTICYISPENIQFSYTLEGFNETNEWITSEYNRTATYTNLSPGKYIFRVKANYKRETWSGKETSINIRILPAPWKTWWAYTIYLFIITSVLFIILRLIWNLKTEKLEKEKINQLDQMRVNFFTNISHELKTPLSLIISPLQKMLSIKKVDFDILSIAKRNADRLLQLVNQLLDIRKVESGTLGLRISNENISEMIEKIVQSFSEHAHQYKIQLNFQSNPNPIYGFTDRDKIEKILFNLLSNAFKFTPDEGNINVFLNHTDPIKKTSDIDSDGSGIKNWVKIIVTDSGKGISPEKLERIFDRFYQTNDFQFHKDEGGIGVGLSLTWDLVQLMKGEINVKSSEKGQEHGTRFSIVLPISKEAYKDHLVSDNIEIAGEQERTFFPFEDQKENEQKDIDSLQDNKPVILIIDDNKDIRLFIKKDLSMDYYIIEAANGVEGRKKAMDTIPDIIISDIMMPQKDGIQLGKELKNDTRTSHIPIIFLTAKSGINNRLIGLETGAEYYLTKPFYTEELELLLKNILRNRSKMQEKYSNQIMLEPKHIEVSDADNNFLQKAIDIVERNIDNYSFSFNDFLDDMGMSQSQLYRKFKALTGQTTSEFILSIRLKAAAKMIKETSYTISEITYNTGFTDPSYFRKLFKKQFGVPPSKY